MANCKKQKTKELCLKAYAVKDTNLTTSCIWRRLASTSLGTTQVITMRGNSLYYPDVDYAGSLCSTNVKVTLPASSSPSKASGGWKAYLSLLNGPQNVSLYTFYDNPRHELMSAGCTTDLRRRSCSAYLVVPRNYSGTPAFKKGAWTIAFFTNDTRKIEEFNKDSYLSYPQRLTFQVDTTQRWCSTPSSWPTPAPAISDTVQFGPTTYQLQYYESGLGLDYVKPYFLLTYRAYRVASVNNISWSVKVTEPLPRASTTNKSKSKTNVTVLLVSEEAYLAWNAACTTTCAPPTSKAIVGTLCRGLVCTGKADTLGGAAGQLGYRLLVSYPTINNVGWPGSYAATKPVSTQYATQMVETKINVGAWDLEPGQYVTGRNGIASTATTTNAPEGGKGERALVSVPPLGHPVVISS